MDQARWVTPGASRRRRPATTLISVLLEDPRRSTDALQGGRTMRDGEMDMTSGLKFVGAMERAVTAGDRVAAARHLSDDVVYTVGARAPLRGVDAVIAAIVEQGRLARWDGHTFRAAWIGDGALVVEVESHFTRIADGQPSSFPCADIYRFRDGRICDWRVFADMSPFHSA